jgi:hypothetical protein
VPFSTSDEFIRQAEEQLGIRLPQDFRDYLLSSNGGELGAAGDDWQIHPVFDSSDRKHASRTASHIVRETQQARDWSGFPPNAVAFANNGGGDFLVFLPSSKASGVLDEAVYVWRHETRDVMRLAASFKELS